MPADLFGGAWQLLSDLAEGAGSPVDYVAIGFLASAASLIGGKRRVRPFSTSNWSEPCIIWTAAVGDPSANKSPALDAATYPFCGMEADHALDHADALRDYEAQCERASHEQAAWKDDVKAAQKEKRSTPPKPDAAVFPDEPVRRRLKVVDATVEALGPILAGNPQGFLHYRDELAGWFSSFDRYTTGGREFWLEAYGGRPFTIDRKGAKAPLHIPFNGVSVLGGIQPEKLSDCLTGSDDGLAARFLWAWPESMPFRRPRQIADREQLDAIYRCLDGLAWGIGQSGERVPITLALDERAADLFEEWARENDKGIEDAGALYKGFCGKLKGMVLRLALVAEYLNWALRGGAEPTSISAATVGAVVDFVDGYAKPTAVRVFGDAALPVVERNAAVLARYILRHKPRKINARDVRRTAGLPGLKDAQAVNDAFTQLVEADWLTATPHRAGETVGRQSSDFIVNPTVHEVA
jgi:putative DNA primase/helicase